MTTDFLTPNCLWINPSPMGPGEIVLGIPGYTFGFGFAVRTSLGNVAVPGSPGEFMWGGAAGTYFWVDPKEELAVVFMAQAPFSRRLFYRRAVKQLIYASIVD
jgi:CubicO group peptidase (beta-lactamase class C family)